MEVVFIIFEHLEVRVSFFLLVEIFVPLPVFHRINLILPILVLKTQSTPINLVKFIKMWEKFPTHGIFQSSRKVTRELIFERFKSDDQFFGNQIDGEFS